MSRESEGDREQKNKSIYELNVKMIKDAEKGKNKMRQRAARRSSGSAAMSSPLISCGSVAWGTEWADCGRNNGYHSPRQQMLILIRADLFVTQRDRRTHIGWPSGSPPGDSTRARKAVLAKKNKKKKKPNSFWGRQRGGDRWAASWWSWVWDRKERERRVGAAQHDCGSLRRPAVGHSHAFSVLCNQAACWLECSRTQRNTAADRCPWQRWPRGTRGSLFSHTVIRQESKAAGVVRTRLMWLYARGGREICWLFYVAAKSCQEVHAMFKMS